MGANGAVIAAQPSVSDLATKSLASLVAFLGDVDALTCQVNLVKSIGAPALKNTRYLDMTNALADHFKEASSNELLPIVNTALADVGGVSEFNFQAFNDGRLAVFAADQFQPVADWFAKFPADDAVQPVAAGDNHIDQLKFIHTVFVALDGKTLRVFRKASNARLIQRGNIIARLTGDGYEYVDASTSLVFDTMVDFFLWDGFIFVFNYKKFELILNFREITRSVADAVFAQVILTLPVSNAAGLQDVIKASARHMNKVASMHNKPHIPLLNADRARTIIQIRGLPVQVQAINGVETLIVDSQNQEHVKAYLHILGDDYVESQMTALPYIATEKEI